MERDKYNGNCSNLNVQTWIVGKIVGAEIEKDCVKIYNKSNNENCYYKAAAFLNTVFFLSTQTIFLVIHFLDTLEKLL